MANLTQPVQQKFDPTLPGSKNFDPDQSLAQININEKSVKVYSTILILTTFNFNVAQLSV